MRNYCTILICRTILVERQSAGAYFLGNVRDYTSILMCYYTLVERPPTDPLTHRQGETGAKRKSSRVEIDELIMHMNIQAGNPCAVLTQENAKKFLHNGTVPYYYTTILYNTDYNKCTVLYFTVLYCTVLYYTELLYCTSLLLYYFTALLL